MSSITYVDGDATCPVFTTNKAIITHIVNDVNCWGSGFVMALSNKWKEPEEGFHKASAPHNGPSMMQLGKVQIIKVEPNIYVANLVAQHMVGEDEYGEAPIRYDALIVCLCKISNAIKAFGGSISVHMPRMGAGLARGRWEIIEPIVRIELCERGIPVTVYDWKG